MGVGVGIGFTFVQNITFDRGASVGTFEIELDVAAPKLLLVEILKATMPRAVVRYVRGITRAYINPGDDEGKMSIQTVGVNFSAAWAFNDVIDIESNHVYGVLQTYGVEAARQALVNEVKGVFDVYHIGVDQRHLSLVADYMTFEGGYKALNRIGIGTSPSPLHKASFETTMNFVTKDTIRGNMDALRNPSARIVLGQLVGGGTGC